MLSNDEIAQRLMSDNIKCKCHLCRGSCNKKCLICKRDGCFTGGNLINKIIEKLPSSDDTARPRFPGELHAILKLPNGKPGIANYMGPGTHVVERIKRGDPPRTYADKIAQAHDIRYGLAKTQAEVAAADKKFISSIKAAHGKDSEFNIQLGLRPIQAKVFAEERGILKPGKIASFGNFKEEDLPIVRPKLAELEALGLGQGGELLLAEKKNLNDLSREIKNVTKTITISPTKSKLYGSFVYRAQTYPSDIDVHEVIDSSISKEDAYSKMVDALRTLIKKIHTMPGAYVGDIKAGMDKRFEVDIKDKNFLNILDKWLKDGLVTKSEYDNLENLYLDKSYNLLEEEIRNLQVIRWKEREVLQGFKFLRGRKRLNLIDAVKGKSAIKIDMWAPIDGKYNEITNFFFVVNKLPNGKVELLNTDKEDYLTEMVKQIEKYNKKEFYNPFKATKRMWGIARHTENEPLLKKLTPLFQGDMARINQIMSEISTIILMMENMNVLPVNILRSQIDGFKDRLSYVYEVPIDLDKISSLIDEIIKKLYKPGGGGPAPIPKLKELKEYLEKLRNSGTEQFLNENKITDADIAYIDKIPEKKEIKPFIVQALHASDQ